MEKVLIEIEMENGDVMKGCLLYTSFNDINNQIVFKVHKDSRIFIFGVSREMKFINQ